MPKKWWYKFLFLCFLIGVSVMHMIPTMMPEMNVEKFPVKERINLGLDLQGGLYMILGIDFPAVYREKMTRTAATIVASAQSEKDIVISGNKLVEGGDPLNPEVVLTLANAGKAEEFRAFVKEQYFNIRIALQDGPNFTLAFTGQFITEVQTNTVAQSIEVIRNRIDEFGVSEPVITSHGDEKVLIELPGVKDVERAKNLIGQTAKLEFQIVSEEMSVGEVSALIDEAVRNNPKNFPENQKLSDYVRNLNQKLAGKLPENTELAFERIRDQFGKDTDEKVPYLLNTQVDVTGEDLQDAFVSQDPQTNRPVVALRFNFAGANKFDVLTGDNVGKRLAIVLDGVVKTAPNLTERISGGSAQITLGSGNIEQIYKEAADISTVLRAGALPARLEFQEQRVVGPSLGADSIESGKMAASIAALLVLSFMLIYYRGAGLVSNICLLLNGLFIFAILIGMEATLTLPGIAGIALTLGIAVDANVIVYERIREELRLGKSPVAAVEQGFARALSSIFDANITTAVAAIVLMNFGAGPVRGFGVTLLIGIVTTLFTAVFVNRMLFELWVMKPGKAPQKLSI